MYLNSITYIICLNVHYSIVDNVRASVTNAFIFSTICFLIFVSHFLILIALRIYKKITFIPTQLAGVIHIDRFICLSRIKQIPQRALLTRPFFIVNNSFRAW